jgi:hypothetical protein
MSMAGDSVHSEVSYLYAQSQIKKLRKQATDLCDVDGGRLGTFRGVVFVGTISKKIKNKIKELRQQATDLCDVDGGRLGAVRGVVFVGEAQHSYILACIEPHFR